MRKTGITILAAISLAAMSLSAMASAYGTQTFSHTIFKDNRPQTWASGLQSSAFELERLDWWCISYNGVANLSLTEIAANNGTAGLSSLFTGQDGSVSPYIWHFSYSADSTNGMDGNWQYLDPLATGLHVDKDNRIGSSGSEALVSLIDPVKAKWLRIEHNILLNTDKNVEAVTWGNANIYVTQSAVPEPGTVVAACALLSPAALMFRRKRA